MHEPLAERLSKLTPDAGGLDRDALLFAAGRASVRRGRAWPALAGVLAASQLLTLVLLWPRETPTMTPPLADVKQTAPAEPAPPAHDPSELWSLRRRLSEDGDLPPPDRAPAEQMVSGGPPLRAFGEPPAGLLD
jgi:hypothetical protein